MKFEKFGKRIALCAFIFFALVVAWTIQALLTLPSSEYSAKAKPEQLSWPHYEISAMNGDWTIFRSAAGDAARSGTGPISAHFRLAGTFMEYGDPATATERSRRAILDDLERGRQAMVMEGEDYEDVRVLRVSRDYVVLEKDGRTEELWLSFDGRRSAAQTAAAPSPADDRETRSSLIDEPSRFGRRVGERRWVFEKESLRNYYMEMMDYPERAVDVYETMRPNYDEDMNIQGYIVDIVGEAEFFAAVGLRDGDIVRTVNSMEMSSRNRAEYFMREFMQDRINAVVLGIERDGEQQNLIYLLR